MRLYIANADPERLAEIGQELGLSGTIIPDAIGFGKWGIEPTVIVETDWVAFGIPVEQFTQAVFREYPNEQAIWVDPQDGNKPYNEYQHHA